MADLKKVGAILVAEGADQAAQNWDKVTEASTRNVEAIQRSSQVYGEAQQIQEEYFAQHPVGARGIEQATEKVNLYSAAWQRAFQSFRGIGETPERALEGIARAAEQGIKPIEVLRFNQEALAKETQRLAASGMGWNEIQKEMAVLADKNVTAHKNLTEAGIQSSRAFFALTLASFGLMSIAKELEKAFGDDLPPAIERTTAAVQQIASFGSAGAFVGGAPGAIIGAIVGSVVALGVAAVQVDPQIQQLNQSLNNMSRQDEVIETLARIAGVTKDVAATWVEAARKDSEFAKSLEELVKAAEPVPPIIKAMNQAGLELTGTLDGLSEAVSATGDLLNKFGVGVIAGTTGTIKLLQELAAGKNVLEAWQGALGATQRVMEKGLEVTAEAGIAQADQNRLTREAEAILAETSKEADKLADAQLRLADATEQANFSMAQLAQRTANQYAAAQQQYTNAVSDAADQRANAIFNAEQTLSNRVADLWQDLQNKVVATNQALADKITDINLRAANQIADAQQQLQDRTADIQVQLANRIADIQQALADKVSDIQRDLANKLADLAHQQASDIGKANDKIQDAARDLARKLYEIERTRIEETERLDYDIHNRLMDARTDHDRDRIRRDQQFQQSQIDQQANDDRQDALRDFSDKVAQAQKEKQLAKDSYDYQVALAKQLAQQKMDDARHTADVQIQQAQRQADIQLQQAQRQADQQIAQAIRTAQQQLAVAQREHDQALVLSQKRYQEELAQAQRAYAQQIEAARRAEAQRNADAARSLEQRNATIAQSAELERQQIERTLALAVRAFQRQIAEVMNLVAAVRVLMENYLMLGGVIESIAKIGAAVTANLFDDWINKMQTLSRLGMTGPPPTKESTSTVPLLPRLFGTNMVTPAKTEMSTSNSSMTFIINDATDPKRVAQVIRQELANASWR